MSVVTDNFTDTDGTLVSAHVSPGGETWTSVGLFGEGSYEVLTNQITVSAANTALASRYRWNLADQVSDVAISLVLTFSNTTGSRHFARISARDNMTNSAVSIERLVGGANEGLWSFQLGNNSNIQLSGYDDGLPHTLKLNTTTAGVLTGYIDGVLKGTSTPGGLPDRGRVVMWIGQSGSTGGSPLFDSISVDVAVWGADLTPNNRLAEPLLLVAARARGPAPTGEVFILLTGPHRRHLNEPHTEGGSSGGAAPPITGQLWPRGQKSG